MRIKRFIVIFLLLFVVAILWNAFLHMIILREVNESVQHLRRPDLSAKLWLSLVLTAGVVTLFVWGYGRFVRNNSIREGLIYGFFFALMAGLLVDLNQYILFPIPVKVALLWFIGGVAEFSIYGILVSRLYPVTDIKG
jgi:hypothetical protein